MEDQHPESPPYQVWSLKVLWKTRYNTFNLPRDITWLNDQRDIWLDKWGPRNLDYHCAKSDACKSCCGSGCMYKVFNLLSDIMWPHDQRDLWHEKWDFLTQITTLLRMTFIGLVLSGDITLSQVVSRDQRSTGWSTWLMMNGTCDLVKACCYLKGKNVLANVLENHTFEKNCDLDRIIIIFHFRVVFIVRSQCSFPRLQLHAIKKLSNNFCCIVSICISSKSISQIFKILFLPGDIEISKFLSLMVLFLSYIFNQKVIFLAKKTPTVESEV